MLKRHWRRVMLMLLDVAASLLAGALSFVIRFDGDIPHDFMTQYYRLQVFVIPFRIVVYYYFGLYSRLWRYASIRELVAVVNAVTIGTLGSALLIYIVPDNGFPRSILAISWFLNILFVGGIRFMRRIRQEISRPANGHDSHRILIVGAGDAGAMIAREMMKHPELGRHPAGFIDDAAVKQGYQVCGLPVLGTRANLVEVVDRHSIHEIIIAMPSAPGRTIREIVAQCKTLDVKLKTLPGIYEMIDGKVTLSHIRDVQIEDLLGRDEIKVDLEEIARYLEGETVLVTGAGGSIGSELCRQIARFKPNKLLLFGHGENSVFNIHLELRETHPEVFSVPIIGDIQDLDRIEKVFSGYKPAVVFHAAAHKHVPLMEINPEEAVKNNVFGTKNVAEAADRHGAKRLVLISTDKAVNPTSVMGATKRAAEILVQTLAKTSQTKFVAVRFGNVLGSRGSVIPVFKQQIAKGGPVTITHPDMTRYFMTIPEAVQLVIQAAAMGRGGEVFVLDMGKPVRILDLAKDLIRLSGLQPERDIAIEYVGVRPGEKLFEEILTAEEGTVATKHKRIFVALPKALAQDSCEEFVCHMKEIALSGSANNETIREMVRSFYEGDVHVAVGQSG